MIHNHTIKDIRTAAVNYGRLSTIKIIRAVVVNDYLQARQIYDDVVTRQAWTKPEIEPDTDGVLSCWTLHKLIKR